MALTEDEKAANKYASSLKKAAHMHRFKEYYAQIDLAESAAKESVQMTALNKAQAEWDKGCGLINDNIAKARCAIAELNEEIRWLEQERAALAETHKPTVNRLWKECAAFRDQLNAKVKADFPDLASHGAMSSMNCWTPPEGYLEDFEKNHYRPKAKVKPGK